MNTINLNIDPYTFTGSAYIIGLILANELTNLEQDSVGNWLQLVGLTIQTYSSQVAVVNSHEKQNNADELSTIKEIIKRMEKELDKIKKDQ